MSGIGLVQVVLLKQEPRRQCTETKKGGPEDHGKGGMREKAKGRANRLCPGQVAQPA
jgi:hypothetical protein